MRTFALVALLGGICAEFSSVVPLAIAGTFIALAVVVSYAVRRHEDPGLTTEVALVTAFLLGALTGTDPVLAGALAVVVFAAAALVVLPLVPDREMGPYGVINPFAIWRLVVLVMAISAAGYIGQRLLGPRLGLALAGFAGGFVSSAATVGAMGTRALQEPRLMRPAVAGAVLWRGSPPRPTARSSPCAPCAARPRTPSTAAGRST